MYDGDAEERSARTCRYRPRGDEIGEVPPAIGADHGDQLPSGEAVSPLRVRSAIIENRFTVAFADKVRHTEPKPPESRTWDSNQPDDTYPGLRRARPIRWFDPSNPA